MREIHPLTKIVGITGGIGMGKSTVARVLADGGLPVIDTDELARQLVEPGQPALGEITRRFGNDLIGPDGCLCRQLLAERVFSNPAARRELEQILHPRIRAAWLARAGDWKAEQRGFGVVVIPLLFETEAAGEFDLTLCVACTEASQLSRLRARGWTDEQIHLRKQAQWPIARKMALADYVIWAEGPLGLLGDQVKRILFPLSPAGVGERGN